MISKTIVLLVMVGFFLIGCAGPTPTASPLAVSPVATPVSNQSAGSTTILEKETPWNEPAQRVVIYQTANRQYGLKILAGGETLVDYPLPADEVFSDVIFAGEESSSAREIGVITSVGNDTYQARVYDVNLKAFVPDSGTGSVAFVSTHVPPFLADLDNDTVPELVTAFDDVNLPSGFVNSKIYVLSDGKYVKSDFLILPPRELSSAQ